MRSLCAGMTLVCVLVSSAWADELQKADRWWQASAKVAQFTTADGKMVRYASVTREDSKGSVVFFTGRTEPVEKYAETLYALRDLPVTLYVYEHRGQGDSEHPLADREKGDVADWRHYVDDARRFLTTVVGEGPVVAVGVSMGGGVLLAASRPDFPAEGMFLVSPMVRFSTDPFPAWLARLLAWGMNGVGLSDSYAPSTGPWAPIPFDDNRLTSDRQRLDAMNRLYATRPELRLGGPTVGWVRQMDLMGDAIMERGVTFQGPVAMALAVDDRVIEGGVARDLCSAARWCGVIDLPGRHELLRENDVVRGRVFDELRVFIERVVLSTTVEPGM